jgi:hypothetical protein
VVAIDCKSGVPSERPSSQGWKALRGARDGDKKTLEHMVSAWANSNNLVLGQLTDDILAVKETQLHLLEDMRDSFKMLPPETVVEEVDCGHGRVENFSRITRIALNLLKQNKTSKLGIKGKRIKAGWDNDYLLHILGI